MRRQFVEALCGKCRVPLKAVIDKDAQDRFACPYCGISDTRDNILWEVGEYTKEVAARHFQANMRRGARGHRLLKLQERLVPTRAYRFIGDLKL